MHRPKALRIARVGTRGDPLVQIERTRASKQVAYLRCYLHDLGARTVVVEPNYFDRDYLSEFSAFYATSSAGYPNICERAHFFSRVVTRELLERAVGGDAVALDALATAYLGHIILRPLPGAPFGRTVLAWYPDEKGIATGTPRVMATRQYHSHVAGLTFDIEGLAWQQQDSAVGACATVALWSMLHSSAFDDHHAIPTTAEITSTAHWAIPDGSRIFPAASGLRLEQMLEVVKGHGLAPVLIAGEQEFGRFSRQGFCTLVGSLIRSGYPVLVHGVVDDQQQTGHAICIVGFRSPPIPKVANAQAALADHDIEVVYIHDDNLGPSVRFRIVEDEDGGSITLQPEAPPPRHGGWPTNNPTTTYEAIFPTEIVVAVHQELRTAPMELQRAAVRHAKWLPAALSLELAPLGTGDLSGMLVSSRFIRLHEYVDRELGVALGSRPRSLARARLELWERIAPMSLHIGLVRVSLGTAPIVDILFDTSDSDSHLIPKAYVAFHSEVPWLRKRWEDASGESVELGGLVRAW